MANNKYGYCNYCGKYRPLRFNGGYCTQQCYKESGQSVRDVRNEIARRADVETIWYTSNSLRSHLYRIVLCAIVWTVLGFVGGLILGVVYPGSLAAKFVIRIMNLGLTAWGIIALVVALAQDILIAIFLGRRIITNLILYGVPLGVVALFFISAKMGI